MDHVPASVRTRSLAENIAYFKSFPKSVNGTIGDSKQPNVLASCRASQVMLRPVFGFTNGFPGTKESLCCQMPTHNYHHSSTEHLQFVQPELPNRLGGNGLAPHLKWDSWSQSAAPSILNVSPSLVVIEFRKASTGTVLGIHLRSQACLCQSDFSCFFCPIRASWPLSIWSTSSDTVVSTRCSAVS